MLITGCSSGIGHAAARVLRARGWRVVASARKAQDVQRLNAEGLETIELDVADAASVERGARAALELFGGRIGALVNNAGYSQAGAMEDVSRDELRRQFETNVFGLQDLTNRVLPVMLKQGWGRIVHISSVVGKVTIPMHGSYCASKHAVEALADAQRVELRGTGVGIVLVEPGPIASEFRRSAAREAHAALEGKTSRFSQHYERQLREADTRRPEDVFALPAEAVARAIARALESSSPRARYRVTLPAWLAPLARALATDACYDWMVSRRVPPEEKPARGSQADR